MSLNGWAQEERVLIFQEPGAEQSAERLHEELALVGLQSESRPGTRQDARLALREEKATAVVHLREDGAIIWVRKTGSSEAEPRPARVGRHPNESPELLALRSAELLRGQLLPADPTRPADGVAQPTKKRDRLVSAATGPAVLFRSYGSPTPIWGFDVAIWLDRWGFGPYLAVALVRSNWLRSDGTASFRQLGAGAQVRFLVLESKDHLIEFQGLGRLGLESLSLREESGPPGERLSGNALFGNLAGGGEMTVRINQWFRLGGQLVGGAHLPLTWPSSSDSELPPGQLRIGSASRPRRAQGHFTAAAVGMFVF